VVPPLTLHDVFGTGHLFTARASFDAPGWMPPDQATLDFLSGGSLTVAGGLPVLASARVADPQGLDLLVRSGMQIPGDLRTYDDEQSYRAALASAPERLVLQNVHSPDEVDPQRCWVRPTLLSFLNNKVNLAELAPAEAVPRREVIVLGRGFDDSSVAVPCAIKVVSEESNGGGYGIRLCHTSSDVRAALRDFARCERVIVEEFLPIRRSFCAQFATSAGRIDYLGAPEQVVDAAGSFLGGWLETGCGAPEDAIGIGRSVMDRAVALGYRGFVGVDVAELEDGRFAVLDLNFRVNGSTTPLLWSDSVADRTGMPVMRSAALTFDGWDQLIRVTESAMRDDILVPLATYRPDDHSGEPALLLAMILGATRAEVMSRHDDLARVREPQVR
jgi:hypothetical protein